jgi:hypothetical protein
MTAYYADGSSASGYWGSDTVGIGNVSADGVLFGLASRVANTDMGILALGYPVLNSIVTGEDFLGTLAAGGGISSAGFSLWADDAEGLSGNILFGGIDQSRYDGQLQRVNMPDYYAIYISTLNATGGESIDGDEPLVADRDSLKVSVSPTDSVSTLPEDLAFRIWELANATYEPETGWARIPCDAADGSDLVFSMMLGGKYGPTVDVALADLVLSRDVYPGSRQWTDNGGNWCLFGVQNSTRSGLYSLGKPMWTRTYLVFDAFNREMAVAPVVYGGSSSSSSSSEYDASAVTPFEYYGARIPESKAACTASEWACTGDQSTSRSSYSSGRSGLALPIVFIIIIVVVVVAALIGIGGSIWCCKRQGLCCFSRNRARDAQIARHAAAAAEAGNGAVAFPSDTALASGGPPMMEKYAGAPAPMYAGAFAPAPAFVPPHEQAGLQPHERPVSPLSDMSAASPPPPAQAVAPAPASSAGSEPQPQPHPSPKGKGRAVEE